MQSNIQQFDENGLNSKVVFESMHVECIMLSSSSFCSLFWRWCVPSKVSIISLFRSYQHKFNISLFLTCYSSNIIIFTHCIHLLFYVFELGPNLISKIVFSVCFLVFLSHLSNRRPLDTQVHSLSLSLAHTRFPPLMRWRDRDE